MNNPLDKLFAISREWVSLPRLSDVAKAAIEFLNSNFQFDGGVVSYARHPKKDGADYLRETKRWFTTWGLDTSELELRQAIDASRSFAGEIRQHHWFSVQEVPPVWRAVMERKGIQQVGAWIVNFQREPVGLFVLAKRSQVGAEDRQQISRCMAHIAVVLEVVITRRLAEELSIRDPLTGLLNRRGLLSQFDQLTQGTKRLTLAVIDLDGFKQFNDQKGHLAGDALLQKVGEVLVSHAEAYGGICARMGGDEFLILAHYVVHDPQLAANMISDWILEAGVKASVGCALFGVDGNDFDACYRAADLRLYEMKLQLRSELEPTN